MSAAFLLIGVILAAAIVWNRWRGRSVRGMWTVVALAAVAIGLVTLLVPVETRTSTLSSSGMDGE